MAVVLSIDAGTTGVRTFAIDEDGRIVHRAYREFPQHFPRPGWVEHDPEEIWDATSTTLREVADALAADGTAVAAIGITNQRETVVVWDRTTGAVPHPAIVWQDRRTAPRCDQLRADGVEPLVRARTGLVLDPYFSATKLEWLFTAGGLAPDPDLAFGTVDSWILWRLTGGPDGGVHATDTSNASRTLLFDIDAGAWSDELVDLFGVPRSCLPEVRASSGRLGMTAPECAAGLDRAGERDRRRPAGRTLRAGLLRARDDEEHVRHRVVRADEPRVGAPTGRRGTADDDRVDDRRRDDVRARGRDLRHRRRDPVAARRARHHRRRRGDRPARGERPRLRRRLVRARVHRSRVAVVGSVRARHGARAVAWHRSSAPGARCRRVDGVADARRRRGDDRGVGSGDRRAARRRWRERDGRALPAPGRRARRDRAPTGGPRDDGARCRVPRRHRRGRVVLTR